MAQGQLTIMLVPHSHKRVREITVSRRTLWVFGTGLVAAVVLSLTYAVGFHIRSTYARRLEIASQENTILTQRIQDISAGVATLRTQIDRLDERERMFRMLANLPQVGAETRLMGIGDDFAPEDEEHQSELMTQAMRLGMDVQAGLDQLLRQAELQRQSFDRIESEFSDNIEFRDHLPSIWPVARNQCYISSGFGFRPDPYTGRRRMHKGVDLAGQTGTPIVAAANGVIETVYRGRYIGLEVKIDHGNGYVTQYGHLSSACVQAGQRVTRGQQIGEMGNTGRSTGPHLHYGVFINGRAVNPLDYFYAD